MWNVSAGLVEWCRVQQRGSHERDERRKEEEVFVVGGFEREGLCVI